MSFRRATLCSRNAHKARELEQLLPGWTIQPLDTDEWPPEVGETYYENARAKADFGRRVGDATQWMIGEDSGLEVAALDGRPGLHSARYAPEGAPAIVKLLGELDGVTDREARYVSELVALSPDGEEVRGTGALAGRIGDAPRGSGGFGFDPVFVPDGEDHTVAELGDDWKAQHSHRARAAKALLVALGVVFVLAGVGCGSDKDREHASDALQSFFAATPQGRALAPRFPHVQGALPCTLRSKSVTLRATCSTVVSLAKHDRAVITLTEAWNHGALAHTWFFFVHRDGRIDHVVQEGTPAPHR
ncbi:MAG TPA: non-canonical purine NTP pyrophosphatase [Gaiellaceae bacterium]|nr:non-canonical purine NTP pyrophosphatase [Gaiellaceae bacterium]